jgi:hypothetical protein
MCLACSARILEVEVEQMVAVARGITEEAEEYALTCMTRPFSDLKSRRGEHPPALRTTSPRPRPPTTGSPTHTVGHVSLS